MKKRFAVIPLIVIMMLSLMAGCTQESGPEATDGNGEQEAPAMKLVAVGECTFAPFEYVDEATGQPAGFDVDLIHAIAEAAGFEVEYKNMDWNSLIAALQTGEADLVVSGMTITDERVLEVKFSDPYFESGQGVVRRRRFAIKTLDDLAGKTVAVQINTTADYAAQNWMKFKEEGKPGLSIKRLEQAQTCSTSQSGRCCAVISDLPVIQEYLKNNPDSNIIIPEPAFTVEYYGIAMRKQDKEIHELVNKGLATIKASGKYEELYEKYFGTK